MAIDDSEQQTIRALDTAYAAWAMALTTTEVTALQCYQSSSRAYALVNGVLRGAIDTRTLDAFDKLLVEEVTANLRTALEKGNLPDAVTVWRGLRSVEGAFGVSRADAPSFAGTTGRLQGFASCSVVMSVAVEGFTEPGAPALLRVAVPSGVRAAWMPLVGRAGYADEYELLLEDDLAFEVTAVEESGGILILDCEVRR